MHAQYTLFQQGYNLLDELDPYMKKLAAEVRRCFITLSTWATDHHMSNELKEGVICLLAASSDRCVVDCAELRVDLLIQKLPRSIDAEILMNHMVC